MANRGDIVGQRELLETALREAALAQGLELRARGKGQGLEVGAVEEGALADGGHRGGHIEAFELCLVGKDTCANLLQLAGAFKLEQSEVGSTDTAFVDTL